MQNCFLFELSPLNECEIRVCKNSAIKISPSSNYSRVGHSGPACRTLDWELKCC